MIETEVDMTRKLMLTATAVAGRLLRRPRASLARADTIVADIDSADNSSVQRFIVICRTGFYRPSEK